MSKPMKFAVIGGGSIGRIHAQALVEHADTELYAVAEIREDRLQAFKDTFPVQHAVTDYKRLLQVPEIDAVVISLPNYLHSPVSVEALEAGKHVLCEKPMAMNADHAQKMVEAWKRSGKTLMVSLQRRFENRTSVAKELAKGFGRIYYGRCGWFRRAGIPGWGSWFTREEESGGGPVNDIGVHMLDLCLYFMGYPEPVVVTGATYAAFGPKGLGKGGWGYPEPDGYFDVEDLASFYIRFANGATVLCEVSWAAHTKGREWVEVMGEKGGLMLGDGSSLDVFTTVNGVEVDAQPSFRRNDSRSDLLTHFVECCRSGAEPLTSPRHGLILNKILTAAYESARKGGEQVKIG